MIYIMKLSKDNIEYVVDYSKIEDKNVSDEEVKSFLIK